MKNTKVKTTLEILAEGEVRAFWFAFGVVILTVITLIWFFYDFIHKWILFGLGAAGVLITISVVAGGIPLWMIHRERKYLNYDKRTK